MADGTAKDIKDVDIGDEVLATDPETGETRAETVTAEIKGKGLKHLVRVSIDIDGEKGKRTASIVATDGHPFWVPELGEWIDATHLKEGEWLRTSAGTLIQIAAVKRWTSLNDTVHNITVSDLHTYYVLAGAVPLLVHNAKPGPDGSCQLPLFVLQDGETSTAAQIANSTPGGGSRVGQAGVRQQLLDEADGDYRCWRCGMETDSPGNMHLGHKNVPTSRGGNLASDNVCLEGAACNLSAGNRGSASW